MGGRCIGIIGGSGLDDPQFLTERREESIDTPYGAPSSVPLCGRLQGCEVVMLARHGREHTIPPSQINSRANLWALQKLGCSRVISTAACGSLRAELDQGALVVPDQFIDFTRQRPLTFFEAFAPGIENARHTPMADPFDAGLRQALLESARALGHAAHDGATILTIEGPRFSTCAESHMFRAWGADLINMTVAPEVILANELGLAYATLAVVTDFDSWKDDEPPLQVADLIQVFHANVARVTAVLLKTLERLAAV